MILGRAEANLVIGGGINGTHLVDKQHTGANTLHNLETMRTATI
jgi:hypothetical protein